MPTATSTLGWTLTSWGPLPATYTTPPSCTGSTDIWIAYTDVPWAPFWPEVCATETTETCWPIPTDQTSYEEYENNPYLMMTGAHSSMTVPENGICYELLPSHSVSTACDGEWTRVNSTTVVSTSYMLNGTTRTGGVVIPATDSVYPLAVTSTATTFSAQQTGELVAVRLHGALILVHRESDVRPADESTEEEDENAGAETNVAMARFYTGDSGWGQIWGMLGAIGTSGLIRVLLVLHV
ncbi:hypothetical protein BJY01DRAFT_253982 [Aspergillus pseudoustus]|uniref:Uncharacterized protein n=1 Tax=Aspergillus pseudoustus TaxID=1810923 RepID=A0ABR4IWR3_9EURO